MRNLGLRLSVWAAVAGVVLSVTPPANDVALGTRGVVFGLVGNCANTSIGETPLIDMGDATYLGAEGGLYADGSNTIPVDHQEVGLLLASHIGPLDADGEPTANGKIGLVGVGVSTTADDWEGFEPLVAAEPRVNPQVVLVNGGISGNPLGEWVDPANISWTFLMNHVLREKLTPAQVQVAWIMMPDRYAVPPPFPDRQVAYVEQLQIVLRMLKASYPNLTMAYLSSHQYAGYGTGRIQEPGNGYEHGFGVKWTIESQIVGEGNINGDPAKGPLVSPWIAWGPYNWADGLIPRSDGLIWECGDFARDGSHPSDEGSNKVGQALLDFLMTDPTASPWFLGEGVEPVAPVTTAVASATTASTTTAPVTTTSAAPETTTSSTSQPLVTTATSAPPVSEQPTEPGSPLPWVIGGLVLIAAIAVVLVARSRSV